MNSEIKSRLVIGIIGGIAILLGNCLNLESLLFVLAILWCFSFIELTSLLGLKNMNRDYFLLTSAYLFILIFYAATNCFANQTVLWMMLLSLVWLIALLLIYFINPIQIRFRIILFSLYLTFPYVVMVLIRKQFGSKIFLFLLLIVWSLDIFSYFFGKQFGKHLIAPKISPKKTWEGTLFGLLISCIVVVFGFRWLGYTGNVFIWIAGLLLPSFGFLGDLFESSIKRRFNQKDSGSMLQGHGGFLDRFDSLLFVSVAFYLLLRFL